MGWPPGYDPDEVLAIPPDDGEDYSDTLLGKLLFEKGIEL
jgi:hypothetical protein